MLKPAERTRWLRDDVKGMKRRGRKTGEGVPVEVIVNQESRVTETKGEDPRSEWSERSGVQPHKEVKRKLCLEELQP